MRTPSGRTAECHYMAEYPYTSPFYPWHRGIDFSMRMWFTTLRTLAVVSSLVRRLGGVWEACCSVVGVPVPKILSLNIRMCTVATFSRWVYYSLCVRRGQIGLSRKKWSPQNFSGKSGLGDQFPRSLLAEKNRSYHGKSIPPARS